MSGHPGVPRPAELVDRVQPRKFSATSRELAAAGITDPGLQSGYLQARRLNAQHGKTYYLATLLLPRRKRPHVHALYGFARYADDVVDDLGPDSTLPMRAEQFTRFSEMMSADLVRGSSTDAICSALLHTQARWDIPASYFVDFLASMHMDLTVDRYPTYPDLLGYMWGSAAVIGLQMLPILGRRDEQTPWDQLRPFAENLGIAFQLTNFIRDVAEDLDRGRVYLPQDSLASFGVDDDQLRRARATGVIDRSIGDLIAAEVDRAHQLYRAALPGVELVHPTSKDCLVTALHLYEGILHNIRAADYNVFAGRVTVGKAARIRAGSLGLVRAYAARAPGRAARATG